MPYLSKQSIIQHAITQGFTNNMSKSEVTQHKKEPMKKESKAPKQLPMVGRYKTPSKSTTKNIESYNSFEDKTFKEYRNGLMKKITEITANTTLKDENKRNNFIESIRTSKDIGTLLFDTSIVKTLDKLDGMPKLLLTVYCKWIEAYF